MKRLTANRIQTSWHVTLAVALAVAASAAHAREIDAFGANPTLAASPAHDVRTELFEWLAGLTLDDETRGEVDRDWPADDVDLDGPAQLERLGRILAAVDERFGELIALCDRPRNDVALPDFAWLDDDRLPPLVRHNLRLVYGRWLSHERLFDESLEWLAPLEPEDVVDPASLLFYQAVGYHQLMMKTEGLAAISRLLTDVADSPRRFTALAVLMEDDLKGLEDDTLDHIARRMGDVRRRLGLGRAGPRVRGIEDGVIESLDKLIEKLEEQSQSGQGGSVGQGQAQPTQPAPDSRILPGAGPGRVESKDIGSGSGWGDLPPKEREEAMQRIGRQFPSHYRDVIEQYFRRLADQSSDEP